MKILISIIFLVPHEFPIEEENNCKYTFILLKNLIPLLACVAGGMRERASDGGAAIFLATRVHGFATKTKALSHEIPPAM